MASVTYKIGGQYDGRALKSAKKDLSDLANVVKGFAVFKVAQQLGKLANATKGVFLEQNKALTSFNVAVSKSGIQLEKLNNLKKELSHGNFIDDDSINNAMKLGIQMGLNAEQLEKVTKTAIDMASAGVKPLDKAMKELTKTALKNEDEFDQIAQRYEGFTEALSNTFSGRDTQWKNSVSDLKAGIGGIFQGFEFLTQGKFIEPLNKITEWIVDNRNYIINFFLHLPEVTSVIFKTIGQIIERSLSAEVIVNTWSAFFQTVYDNFIALKNSFEEMTISLVLGVIELVKDLGNKIFEVMSEVFDRLADRLSDNLFETIKSYFKMVMKLVEYIQNPKKLIGDIALREFAQMKYVSNKVKGQSQSGDITSVNYFKNIAKVGMDFTKEFSKNIIKLSGDVADNYSDILTGSADNIKDILAQDLPAELLNNYKGLVLKTGSGDEESEDSGKVSRFAGSSVIGSTALSGIGEIGSIVQSVMQNGLWGAIAEILGKILARVEEVSPIFQYFQNILSELLDVLINPESGLIKAIEGAIQPFLDGFNAVKDILGGILEFLSGIINSLTPILQGFTMILNKIAPVITSILDVLGLLFNIVGIIGEMLNPILEVILDVIAPILEVINYIIKAVYKVIATIINIIIDIYNAISWGSDKSHISTEIGSNTSVLTGYDKYNPDLSGYATASASSTSGSASYQSAKDIYLTINFDHSFVNGDGREMALLIRDEIRSAERLGY